MGMIDINKFIEREVDGENFNNEKYKQALLFSFYEYRNYSLERLKKFQEIAKEIYKNNMPKHNIIADCVILNKLIKDKEI